MTFPGKPFAPFTWSYSRLKNFETCPKREFHYGIQRDVVEPETDQLREGNALHAAFDARIKHGTELPLGMGHHEALLARIVGAPGQTYSEQKLAITSSFLPAGYFGKGVWFRTVIDAAKVNNDVASVFDWKTGKPSEDITQLQLMSATMFHHMPKLQRVRAALMFVNHNHVERAEFVREDVTEIWSEILPRVKKLEQARNDMEYPPKPSGLCKKYCAVLSCPYHGRGG
jgi:hypothetical protein